MKEKTGQHQEMIIFVKTFDLLDWLLPATNHLPRAHRHTFTKRLLDAAFDLRERLDEANYRKGTARNRNKLMCDTKTALACERQSFVIARFGNQGRILPDYSTANGWEQI